MHKLLYDLCIRTINYLQSLFGRIVIGGVCLVALCNAGYAQAASPAACQALQAKYPQFQGKTLVNAFNPQTPGYESLDPKDPSKYIGFDIDLGEAIGECLGFKLTYTPVTFAALLTTLASGQADLVLSDIYATEERAKTADFITYLKIYDGVLVNKGNPKKITGLNTSLCGVTAAESTGFAEVVLIQNLSQACKAEGKPAPVLQLYDSHSNCIQALLSGRADVFINDVNTVDQSYKAYPNKFERAANVALPFSVGIAVAKGNTDLRNAILAALIEIQKNGMQSKLIKKWSLDESQLEQPRLVVRK